MMRSTTTMYCFDVETGKIHVDRATPHGLEGRFWNTNWPVAVVARVNPGLDWAAYIGAGETFYSTEEQTLSFVARMGAKLTEEEARCWFPDMDEPYRG